MSKIRKFKIAITISILVSLIIIILLFLASIYMRNQSLIIAENEKKNILKKIINIYDYIDVTQPIEYIYCKVPVTLDKPIIYYEKDDYESSKKENKVLFCPGTESYLGLIETLRNAIITEYVPGRDGGYIWIMRKDSPVPDVSPSVSILRQPQSKFHMEIIIMDFGFVIIKINSEEIMRCRSDIDLFYTLMLARPVK